MIEIEGPPGRADCASCSSRLSWLWSPKVRGWICVIPIDDVSFRLHECKHAQQPATWRQLQTADPPSAEYVEFRQKIKNSTEGDER